MAHQNLSTKQLKQPSQEIEMKDERIEEAKKITRSPRITEILDDVQSDLDELSKVWTIVISEDIEFLKGNRERPSELGNQLRKEAS